MYNVHVHTCMSTFVHFLTLSCLCSVFLTFFMFCLSNSACFTPQYTLRGTIMYIHTYTHVYTCIHIHVDLFNTRADFVCIYSCVYIHNRSE